MIGDKKLALIITAAGKGQRMKSEGSKLLMDLSGKPVLQWTLDKCLSLDQVDRFILVIREEDRKFIEENLDFKGREILLVKGGESREESTLNGLRAAEGVSFVICHDGARPFTSIEIFQRAIRLLSLGKNSIAAVPCKDSIKLIEDGLVKESPDRSKLYNVQTPQAFLYDDIMEAYSFYEKMRPKVTDDSSLLDYVDKECYVIEGSYENIKITTKEDLLYGEFILSQDGAGL